MFNQHSNKQVGLQDPTLYTRSAGGEEGWPSAARRRRCWAWTELGPEGGWVVPFTPWLSSDAHSRGPLSSLGPPGFDSSHLGAWGSQRNSRERQPSNPRVTVRYRAQNSWHEKLEEINGNHKREQQRLPGMESVLHHRKLNFWKWKI